MFEDFQPKSYIRCARIKSRIALEPSCARRDIVARPRESKSRLPAGRRNDACETRRKEMRGISRQIDVNVRAAQADTRMRFPISRSLRDSPSRVRSVVVRSVGRPIKREKKRNTVARLCGAHPFLIPTLAAPSVLLTAAPSARAPSAARRRIVLRTTADIRRATPILTRDVVGHMELHCRPIYSVSDPSIAADAEMDQSLAGSRV